MDANGTRFHLLLGKPDWARCQDRFGLPVAKPKHASAVVSDEVEWSERQAALMLKSRLLKFTASKADRPPRLADRRGAARDRYGNWYWIAEGQREILVRSSGSGALSRFWSEDDASKCASDAAPADFAPAVMVDSTVSVAGMNDAPAHFSGLAVTDDHYLVVGIVKKASVAGLLIFDLHAGGPPSQLWWPANAPFQPFDMAARPEGGVWVLDRENRRYWELDRQFNVVRREQSEIVIDIGEEDAFQPQNPADSSDKRRGSVRSFPGGITLDAASPLALSEPIAIEALPDCTVLILENDLESPFARVWRFHYSVPLGQPVSTEMLCDRIEVESGDAASGLAQPACALRAHDFAFVPEHEDPAGGEVVPDRLVIASDGGNQTFAFDLSLNGDQLVMKPAGDPLLYLPMRLFGGKGIVAAGGQAYYDFGDRWLPLVEQRRPRYAPEAVIYTYLLDGCEPDCVWHRLMVDACIPPGAGVAIFSAASDDQHALDLPLPESAWRAEPRLYLRGDGSELPFAAGSTSAIRGHGTWELLFQRAQGRFLRLKIVLTGDERSTPRLFALRAYYPRFSYLARYLPAVYREDAHSASFLDRFLANIEGLYTTLEDKIGAAEMLFDVRSAPADALDWLASWFDVTLDPAWDETRRRLFIAHAVDFFRCRGTLPGLTMALRLALDACVDDSLFDRSARAVSTNANAIRIVERYLTRPAHGAALAAQAGWWLPAQGRSQLNARYAIFLREQYPRVAYLIQTAEFPTVNPTWQQMSGGSPATAPQQESAVEPWLWRDFLMRRYATVALLNAAHETSYANFTQVAVPVRFTAQVIEDWNDYVAEKAERWRAFATGALGFIPAASEDDQRAWQRFLLRRYAEIETMNAAHALGGSQRPASFSDARLPMMLPADGVMLADWHVFQSQVLPMLQPAHRFSVALPVPVKELHQPQAQQQRANLARRIVNLEKPAHTVFDIRFYWDMFRVGEARLGQDTLLDRGSRAPQLLPPMVLGQGYLVEGTLAPSHPQDVPDRFVTGRNWLQG